MHRFRVDIASAKPAFYLIALIALQVIVAAIVPQRDLAAGGLAGLHERLGPDNPVVRALWLDRIYYSPLFYVSLGLLAVNLTAANVRRVKRIARARDALSRLRQLGSVVFHFSLLLTLAGILLNNVFGFAGTLAVTEGQRIDDQPQNYVEYTRGYLARRGFGRFTLGLERLDRERRIGDDTTEEALVTVESGGGPPPVTGPIRVNKPLRWNGMEFHSGPRTGYSPLIVVTDATRRQVFRSFVRVRAEGSGQDAVHEDFLPLPEQDLTLGLRIVPEGPDADRARRFVTVDRGEETLFTGELAAADTAAVAGYRITVPSVRNWCYLRVVVNPMLWLVFTGFWVALAGLAVSVVPRVVPRPEKTP